MEESAADPLNPRTRAGRVCAALNAAGAHYLVIGGVACILHGYVRATTDIDILIERKLENARVILDALSELGWGLAREWFPEEILKRPITVIGDDPQVDIFTVAWTVKYETAIANALTVDVDGVAIPLIGLEDLIETKRTNRPLDAADIEALEEIRRLRGPETSPGE